jgi:prepilin-type N-terminal cleavage/methylation domain-containing protein
MPKTFKKIQSGFTIIELLIVIAIIGILAGLVLNNFQGAQAKSRDVQRKTRINSIYSKLEEYYNNNGGYPDGTLSTTVLPGIDAAALTDASGGAIQYDFVTAASATTHTVAKGSGTEFNYAAYSCTNAGAQATVGATCQKYVLRSYMEKDTGNLYSKSSLN